MSLHSFSAVWASDMYDAPTVDSMLPLPAQQMKIPQQNSNMMGSFQQQNSMQQNQVGLFQNPFPNQESSNMGFQHHNSNIGFQQSNQQNGFLNIPTPLHQHAREIAGENAIMAGMKRGRSEEEELNMLKMRKVM